MGASHLLVSLKIQLSVYAFGMKSRIFDQAVSIICYEIIAFLL